MSRRRAMPLLAIVNTATDLDDEAVAVAVRAVEEQVREHLDRAWQRSARLMHVPRGARPPAGSWPIYLRDYLTPRGATGRHHRGAQGPWGEVGVRAALELDGQPWSIMLSHEVIETLVNPDCNLCVEVLARVYQFEVCDAVRGQSYDIGGVQVANFVTRSWFVPASRGPWDHLGQLTGPLSRGSGGYSTTAYRQKWEVEIGS